MLRSGLWSCWGWCSKTKQLTVDIAQRRKVEPWGRWTLWGQDCKRILDMKSQLLATYCKQAHTNSRKKRQTSLCAVQLRCPLTPTPACAFLQAHAARTLLRRAHCYVTNKSPAHPTSPLHRLHHFTVSFVFFGYHRNNNDIFFSFVCKLNFFNPTIYVLL